jgi:hypothetical protein
VRYLFAILIFISCTKESPDKVDINCIEIDAAKGGTRGKPKTEVVVTTPGTFSILLDVDGHNVNSPSWNGGVPFYAEPSGPFDTSSAFKLARSKFQYFNVSLTTSEADWLKATYRVRCVITTSDFYPNVAGVAYTGSFKSGTDFFVFSDRLYYDVGRIGNCIAHESGHSIGLSHQALWDANCNLLSSYNSGSNGTAPIMGNPVGKLGLWWVGPTPYGCKDIQYDSLKMVAALK